MSEETTTEPLNLEIDLTTVDTSYPILAEGTILLRITKALIVPKKGDDTKRNLELHFETIAENPSKSGEIINAGYRLCSWYPLQQSDNPKAPPYARGLAELVDAVFNPQSDADRPLFCQETVNTMPGREVQAIVKIRGSIDDEFGIQNDIKKLLPIG